MVRTEQTEPVARPLLRARGGVSLAAVLTGVVVAIGAFFLLSALVGGVLSVSGIEADDLAEGTDAGLGAGIALIAAFFLAYLWGGYTAGRMSRGAGFVNGLLVPVVALLVGIAVGAVVVALGSEAELNLPFSANRLPLEDDYVVDWTLGLGAATLGAMFLGGILGGLLGSRWHTKLERKVAAEQQARAVEAAPVPTADADDPWRRTEPGYTDPTAPIHVERHPSVGGTPPPPPPPDRQVTQPGARPSHGAPPPPPPPDEHQPTQEIPPAR